MTSWSIGTRIVLTDSHRAGGAPIFGRVAGHAVVEGDEGCVDFLLVVELENGGGWMFGRGLFVSSIVVHPENARVVRSEGGA